MPRSIRTRLIITLIGLAIVPLLSVGAILAYQSFSTQRDQVLAVQHEIAHRASLQVSDLLRELENELQLTIRVRPFKGQTSDQQKSTLQILLAYRNAFDRIYLLDNTGQELLGVSRGSIITASDLVSRAQNDEFTLPARDRKVYYSPVHVDSVTAQPEITIGIPVIDLQSDSVQNVLVADLRFKTVQDMVVSMDTTPQGVIYIVDSNHRVVVHRDPSISLKDTYFTPPATDGIYNGLSGSSAVIASDTLSVGDQRLIVVAEAPVSEALALAINTVAVTSILVVITLLSAIVLGIFAIRAIIRPVQGLTETVRAITNGDLTRQAAVNSNDEIGELARGFNTMTARLRETLDGLRQRVVEIEAGRIERERLIRELREASRLKSQFLSTMSHELRTPLNSIMGFTDLILTGRPGPLTDTQRSFLERVASNNRRLLALINDVLDLARIEAGRMEIQLAPYAPGQMLERVVAQTSSLFEQKGLAFKTILEPTLPENVMGDRSHVEQVIINLLSNAAKFTLSGEVVLSASGTADGKWCIVVRDTGIGIAPHMHEVIFEPFRQVDGSTTRQIGGSGLGLAIARDLCQMMNASIGLASEVGKGTTFTVTLPVAEDEPTKPVPQLSTSA
ncbi:MAG TPA: ATP-binding protein [Aggregatilineales bacterium]|nr:ATP-binding protein [Aggregatilineales bacterium]